MITLAYGPRQPFRKHHADVNVIGAVEASLPIRSAVYRLNQDPPSPFYVDDVPNPGVDFSFEYKRGPARLRLTQPGDFNIEIPVGRMRAGANELVIEVEDAMGTRHELSATLDWDPEPVALPLEVDDLSGFQTAQEIGQVVDGAFDLDPFAGVVRPRAPVKPDSLLLLGPPAGSQEAVFEWRYFDGSRSKYVGLSDFFVAHESEDPALPIKPGWSTAGLATIRPRGEFAWEARIWLAHADRPGWRPNVTGAAAGRPRVVRTDPPAYFRPEPGRWHSVRHQLLFDDGANRSRVRIWECDRPEPDDWLCDEIDRSSGAHQRASFGLFQHSGLPCEWRRIRLAAL